MEIFDAWGRPYVFVDAAKEAFYGFFQNNAFCFDDTVDTLKALRKKNIKIGVLTDVAYGMDNKFPCAT
jgi:putative hydrolase of the HAD superfamily